MCDSQWKMKMIDLSQLPTYDTMTDYYRTENIKFYAKIGSSIHEIVIFEQMG